MADPIHVKGADALAAKLKALPAKVARNALRRAVAAGAAVVRKEARRRAPIGSVPRRRGGLMVPPGTLRRAAMSFHIRAQSGDVQQTFGVAFKQGRREQLKKRDAYYWQWVEAGHKIIPRKGKGGLTLQARRRAHKSGFVQGLRFLAGAFAATRQQAIAAITAKLRADFDKLTQ